jgi:xyloglucan-specific exo-beta-1,4-glucanase
MKINFQRLVLVGTLGLFMSALGCGEGLDDASPEDSETESDAATSTEAHAWRTVAMGGTGFVTGLVAHPKQKNLFYARTDVGGAYRWNETLGGWSPMTDWVSPSETTFLGVESIAVDPSDPAKVYLLAGTTYWNGGKTGILRSSDYGTTFQVTDVTASLQASGNGPKRGSGERLSVDPNKGSILFTGSRNDGLFKSADAGVTWTRVTSFPATTTADGNGIHFVVFDPSTGSAGSATRTIYAGVSRSGAASLYRSTDAGATWAPVAGAPTANVPFRAVLAGSSLYVTYTRVDTTRDGGTLLKLNTRTGAWTDVTPFPAARRSMGGVSVDASNPQRLLASTMEIYQNRQPWGWGDDLYVSTDGGATWQDALDTRDTMDANGMPWIPDHAIHWASSVLIDPFNPERAFVTSGNGVFGTDALGDGSSSIPWKFQSKGLEEAVSIDLVSTPNGRLLSAILDYDGFSHADPAVHVDSNSTGGNMTSVTAAETRPATWVRAGGRLYWTDDSGATWVEIPRPTTGSGGNAALSADGSVLLYQPSGSTTMYRTTDKGRSWSAVAGLPSGMTSARPTADLVDPRKFYVYNSATGMMWVSANGGVSFTQAGRVVEGGGSRLIRAVPGVAGEVWVAAGAGGLRRSTDSGATFTGIPTVQKASAVSFGKAAPGKTYPTVFVWGNMTDSPTVAGLYRSTNAGASWVRVNDDDHEFGGLANGYYIVGDRTTYGRVYMSTAGRGIVYAEPRAFQFSVPRNAINAWWIQVSVRSTSGRAVQRVSAKVNDSTYALSKDPWGSWVTSKFVPAGTEVLFTAVDDAGRTETFSSNPWPK